MNEDEAWIAFNKSNSIKKASVGERLDVMASQLNEIQTDTKRLAQMVPKIMADENVIDQANEEAADMPPMGGGIGTPPGDMGAPPMGGMPGEDSGGMMMPDEEEMNDTETPTGEDMDVEGEMPEDVGTESDIPESNEVSGETPEDVDENDEGIEEPTEDFGDEETEAMPEEDLEMPEGDVGGPANEGDAVSLLKEAMQEAMDKGEFALVAKIAQAAEAVGSAAEEPMSDETDYTPTEEESDTYPIAESAGEDIEEAKEEVKESVDEVIDRIFGEIFGDKETEEAPEETAEVEPDATVVIETEDEPKADEEAKEEDDDDELAEKNEELSEEGEESISECGCNKDIAKSDNMLSFKDMMASRFAAKFAKADVGAPQEGQINDVGGPVATGGFAESDNAENMESSDTENLNSAKNLVGANATIPTGERQEYKDTSENFSDTVDEEPTQTEDEMPIADTETPATPPIGMGADGASLDTQPVAASASAGSVSTIADEVKKPQQLIKPRHESEGGDMLDEVGEKMKQGDCSEGTKKKVSGATPETRNTGDHTNDIAHSDPIMSVGKSDEGKHIISMRELMSIRKSQARPDSISTINGDIKRPELGSATIKKSESKTAKMGFGIDPKKVTENDWAEYKSYMAQKGF